MSRLEQAEANSVGAGKRAFLVTKEFTLQECFAKSRAVDADQGFIGATARPMDRTGYQFLPGSRLSADQDGGFGRPNPPDEILETGYLGTTAANLCLTLEIAHRVSKEFVLTP